MGYDLWRLWRGNVRGYGWWRVRLSGVEECGGIKGRVQECPGKSVVLYVMLSAEAEECLCTWAWKNPRLFPCSPASVHSPQDQALPSLSHMVTIFGWPLKWSMTSASCWTCLSCCSLRQSLLMVLQHRLR